jgi:hypothetical protein
VPPSGVLPSRHLLHPFRQSNPPSNSLAISSALDLSLSLSLSLSAECVLVWWSGRASAQTLQSKAWNGKEAKKKLRQISRQKYSEKKSNIYIPRIGGIFRNFYL